MPHNAVRHHSSVARARHSGRSDERTPSSRSRQGQQTEGQLAILAAVEVQTECGSGRGLHVTASLLTATPRFAPRRACPMSGCTICDSIVHYCILIHCYHCCFSPSISVRHHIVTGFDLYPDATCRVTRRHLLLFSNCSKMFGTFCQQLTCAGRGPAKTIGKLLGCTQVRPTARRHPRLSQIRDQTE